MAKLKPWILVDPAHKHPDTFGPLFRGKDGKTVSEPDDADTFDTEDEAEEAAMDDPIKWVPKPLDDYWPAKS